VSALLDKFRALQQQELGLRGQVKLAFSKEFIPTMRVSETIFYSHFQPFSHHMSSQTLELFIHIFSHPPFLLPLSSLSPQMYYQEAPELFTRIMSPVAAELFTLSADAAAALIQTSNTVKRRSDACTTALEQWSGAVKAFGQGKTQTDKVNRVRVVIMR